MFGELSRCWYGVPDEKPGSSSICPRVHIDTLTTDDPPYQQIIPTGDIVWKTFGAKLYRFAFVTSEGKAGAHYRDVLPLKPPLNRSIKVNEV